jgi:hypothetical protein
VIANQEYNFYYISENVDTKTDISVQLGKSYATTSVADETVENVLFPKKTTYGGKKNINLFATLHSRKSGRDICLTKNFTVHVDTRNLLVFIQTDKPIYKPGDDVRFRIVVVDRDIKPAALNNINVYIKDPVNVKIEEFEDMSEMKMGVFNETFKLASETLTGNWEIQVMVNKQKSDIWKKTFAVDKFALPLFNGYLEIPEKNIIYGDDLLIKFYAKYPFGGHVAGKVNLIINSTKLVHYNMNVDIQDLFSKTLNTKLDLKLSKSNKIEIDVTVEFTEPESKFTVTKTQTCFIHAEARPIIKVRHGNSFMPGMPFTLEVQLFSYKSERITDLYEEFKVVNSFISQKGFQKHGIISRNVDNNVIIVDIQIPGDTSSFEFSVEYKNAQKYYKKIEKGTVNVNKDGLIVDHSPKE